MNDITKSISDTIAIKKKLLADEDTLAMIEASIKDIVGCYQNGGKVLFCGNGGSAADAQHLAAELTGRFYYDREPLDAEALNANSSHLTAVANDYHFDKIFSRLVAAKGKSGDILVGLSTSGNSANVVAAVEEAKEKGMITIALTGGTGGLLKNMADRTIKVPSSDTPRIQELHILIGHIICEQVEKKLFPQK